MPKKYNCVFTLGFQTALEYRGNYIMNLISIFFPIMMQYFVWTVIYAGKPKDAVLFGLTYSQAMMYTLCAGFIARLLNIGFHYQISQDIKNGTLNQFLVQPINYILYQTIRFLGVKLSEFIILFSLMLLFLFGIAPTLGLQVTGFSCIRFLIAIIPAMILNFFLFLYVSMIAFWVVEVARLYAIIDIMIAIVSGNIFPLSIFGEEAIKVFQFLPFSYTTYFLTNLINGTTKGDEFLWGIVMQFLWSILLGCICYFTWKNGLKKYTAIGG